MRRQDTERKYQRRLKKICKLHSGHRGGRFKNIRYKNIEFADDPGEWPCRVIPGKHSFLKKTSHAKDLKKYAKRFANRAVRRSGMNEVMKGCSYKRYWNYWKKYDL